MHLLIVENDSLLNSILSNRLIECGYHVDSCFNLLDGMSFTKNGHYDCIIADTKLPINSALLLETLNIRFNSSAILLLTTTKMPRFPNYKHLGVIEYLSKPFTFEQLLMSIELLLQKNQKHNHILLQADNLVLNTKSHTVTRGDIPILLTDKEFALLEYLLIHKGEILSREQISTDVWHAEISDCSNNVDVYVRYLRNKIDKDFETKLIITVRGAGYCIK